MSDRFDVSEGSAASMAQRGLSALELLSQFRVGLLLLSFALFMDVALLVTGRPNLFQFDPRTSAVPLGALIVFVGVYGLIMSLGVAVARKATEDLLWAFRLSSWSRGFLFWEGGSSNDDKRESRWAGGYVSLREASLQAQSDKDTFWMSRVDEASRQAEQREREKRTMAHLSFGCAVLFMIDLIMGGDSMVLALHRYLEGLVAESPFMASLCTFFVLAVLASPWHLHFWSGYRTESIQHPELAKVLMKEERARKAKFMGVDLESTYRFRAGRAPGAHSNE